MVMPRWPRADLCGETKYPLCDFRGKELEDETYGTRLTGPSREPDSPLPWRRLPVPDLPPEKEDEGKGKEAGKGLVAV